MLKRDDGAELSAILKDEQPDITFLQEHKFQDIHVPKHEPDVLRIFDEACADKGPHRATWAVSLQRKGYSGTCAIYHSDAGGGVVDASTGVVGKVEQAEGRSVSLALNCGLTVVGVYVPNSGQQLARLAYRVNEWDKSLRSYLGQARGRGGVVLCGDLNVAHQDLDIWNAAEPRILKQAGTTAEERASFSRFLSELDMVDAFRWLNPEAAGMYTYWSRRHRLRPVNKGLRLDYFLLSRFIAEGTTQVTLQDCRILSKYGGSDHCPVVCSMFI
ncbi:ARP [Symbiodinium pilosum]|uniref:ARP protein n=1 Tax=Symbiodinium pilosum TaxID=2952 RepID=A0A812XFV0_SYMPI|nr:ARP [Symbiodinium pilosum]